MIRSASGTCTVGWEARLSNQPCLKPRAARLRRRGVVHAPTRTEQNLPESSASAGEALPGLRASIVHAHTAKPPAAQKSSVFSAAQFALSRHKKKAAFETAAFSLFTFDRRSIIMSAAMTAAMPAGPVPRAAADVARAAITVRRRPMHQDRSAHDRIGDTFHANHRPGASRLCSDIPVPARRPVPVPAVEQSTLHGGRSIIGRRRWRHIDRRPGGIHPRSKESEQGYGNIYINARQSRARRHQPHSKYECNCNESDLDPVLLHGMPPFL